MTIAAGSDGSSRDAASVAASTGRHLSVFILPFRYRIEPDPRPLGPSEARFVRAEGGDRFDGTTAARSPADVRWRRQYLTGETREILFGPDLDPTQPHVQRHLERRVFEYLLVTPDEGSKAAPALVWSAAPDRTYALPMEVRIVLFEERAASRGLPPHRASGCVGFLLVGVRPPTGAPIEDVLALNERLRYVRFAHPNLRSDLARHQPGPRPLPQGWTPLGGLEGVVLPGHDDGAAAPRGWTRRQDAGCAILFPDASTIPIAPDGPEIALWADLLACRLLRPDETGRRAHRLIVDLSAYPDDRAFLATHVEAQGVRWSSDEGDELATLWHQLLYVEADRAPNHRLPPRALTRTEAAWSEQRSYRRWAESVERGRLYGFSNYSFASLFAPGAWGVPDGHFRGIYLDLLLLVLYQRVAVFAFSRDLAALTEQWASDASPTAPDDRFARLSDLRASFGQFVNLYWFPVFTNQVQGLEMYAIARRELDNVELFGELRQEMEETWSFLDAARQQRVEDAERRFARGATVFGVAGLLLAALGVSNLGVVDGGIAFRWPSSWWFVFAFVFGVVTLVAWRCVVNWGRRTARRDRLGERLGATLRRLVRAAKASIPPARKRRPPRGR